MSGSSRSGDPMEGRLTLSRAVVSEYDGHVVLIVISPSRMTPEAYVFEHDEAVRMQSGLVGALATAVERFRDGRPLPPSAEPGE